MPYNYYDPTFWSRTKLPTNPFLPGVGGGAGGAAGGTGLPADGDLDFSDLPGLQNWVIDTQNRINRSRIPDSGALESESSKRIAELLNPPAMFRDVNRQAAELGAARGVAGSPSAFGTGLRLTDEERLRRIALGESLLSGAYGRNPGAPVIAPVQFGLTPAQREQILLSRQGLLTRGRTVGGGGSNRNPYITGGGGSGGTGTLDLSGLLDFDGGTSVFGGGGGGGRGGGRGGGSGTEFDLDQALRELGLTGEDVGFDLGDFDPNWDYMPEEPDFDYYE